MKNRPYEYIHGATARKFSSNIHEKEKNDILKTKKKKKNNINIKIKIIIGILVIFVMFIIAMYRYTLITELNYNLVNLNSQYEKIKNQNSIYRIKIEQETDLPRIKEIAEQKLNMQKPNKHQIIYVNIQKKDFTKVSNNNISEEVANKNLFVGAYEKMTNFINLFY